MTEFSFFRWTIPLTRPDTIYHSSRDVFWQTHSTQNHPLAFNTAICSKNVRSKKSEPHMMCSAGSEHQCFAWINFLVILMHWPLMRSLYFSGIISGEGATDRLVSAERHEDSWHAQFEFSNLGIFCIIKCCSQVVLEKHLQHWMTTFIQYWNTDTGYLSSH